MHGKVDILTVIQHTKLYNNLANQFNIMRYHSLISDEISFPSQLIITEGQKIAFNLMRQKWITFWYSISSRVVCNRPRTTNN